MRLSENKLNLGARLILVVLGIGVIVLVTVSLIMKNKADHISTMHLAGTTTDGKNYCADFIADEEDDSTIKITITNCGELKIIIKPKGGLDKKALDTDEQFVALLDNGYDFSAKITSARGGYLGAFNF